MPGERLKIEIVRGIMLPDWSVVTSARTVDALGVFLKAFGAETRWTGIPPEEGRLRHVILAQYLVTGHAPTLVSLSELTNFSRQTVARLLKNLNTRDLVVLDEAGEMIVGAYPFSERDMGHRVRLGGSTLNTMCAIDALGAGPMYGKASVIFSSCLGCAQTVRVATGEGGMTIESVSPKNSIVWSGIRETGGCSADTMCKVMAFFCSDDCLNLWSANQDQAPKGFRLSMDEGLQMGKAIFMPLLAMHQY